MKGEYDAEMSWPFKQKITLMLLSQDEKEQNIVQSFTPPTTCNSFQRPSPHSEMNVAFGCPRFAPLSVLDNPAYVKDDAMIFQCVVDTSIVD